MERCLGGGAGGGGVSAFFPLPHGTICKTTECQLQSHHIAHHAERTCPVTTAIPATARRRCRRHQPVLIKTLKLCETSPG